MIVPGKVPQDRSHGGGGGGGKKKKKPNRYLGRKQQLEDRLKLSEDRLCANWIVSVRRSRPLIPLSTRAKGLKTKAEQYEQKCWGRKVKYLLVRSKRPHKVVSVVASSRLFEVQKSLEALLEQQARGFADGRRKGG